MDVASSAERLRDIDDLIKGLAMQVRCAITDRQRPDLIHREVAGIQAQIDELELKKSRALERLHDPIGRIERLEARVQELRKERAMLANSKTVERFFKAREQVEALLTESGMKVDDLGAILAMLQGTPSDH